LADASVRTSSTDSRTCTKRRPLRRDCVTDVTRTPGAVKKARTASRSTRDDAVSEWVPRSALGAASEPFTYIVADPSRDRYISSSYSYWRKRPPLPHDADRSAASATHSSTARGSVRITSNRNKPGVKKRTPSRRERNSHEDAKARSMAPS